MLNTCELGGLAADPFRKLHAELKKDDLNLRYLEGRLALQKLAADEYLIGGGSRYGHVTPQITKAAEKIAAKYAGVPEIEDIAKEMGQKTQGK